jgi:hypothetical protein
MRTADPDQLRPTWLSSGIFDQLRSAEISSGGSKIGARFASVLTTPCVVKPPILASIEVWDPQVAKSVISWVSFVETTHAAAG